MPAASTVVGDIEKTFTNLLVYGTGMGPIGVTRGCFLLNRLGGAVVRVSETGQAVRCNGYVFASSAAAGTGKGPNQKKPE